jgi:hypothetical protein
MAVFSFTAIYFTKTVFSYKWKTIGMENMVAQGLLWWIPGFHFGIL